MAIDNLFFEGLADVINVMRSQEIYKESLNIGCLSYPDMLVSEDEVIKRFPKINRNFKKRSDSEEIKAWHGRSDLNYIIDTDDFFNKIDCNGHYLDFKKIRGNELIIDLNLPIDEAFHCKYDLVIDTGTLEHCFNVGTAFMNMCSLVKVGGYLITAAPMSKMNHGFWNFSPCVYDNFFSKNKFSIEFIAGFQMQKNKAIRIDIQNNNRFLAPSECILAVVAKRLEKVNLTFPIQHKYLANSQ